MIQEMRSLSIPQEMIASSQEKPSACRHTVASQLTGNDAHKRCLLTAIRRSAHS